MNALIPLGIEYADPMRAIATGALARERVDANQTRNALAAAYAQHGAGAMQGDTNALAGIAQYDPAAAQTLYTGVQNNRRADQTLDLNRQDTQSAIGARSAATRISQGHLDVAEQQAAAAMKQASQAERLQTITTFSQFLPELEAAETEGDWNRITTAMGVDDTPFSERPVALAMARGALRGASEETSTLGAGETLVGNRTGRVIAAGAPKSVDQPASVQEYLFAQEGGERRPYSQWLIETKKAGATSVNTNVLPNGQPDPNAAFYGKLDENEGKRFSTILDAAPTVGRTAQQIGQLEDLLKDVETGGWAKAREKLGKLGIETEGLSDVQALSSAISAMVPSQRQPGSGPMSDADLALFKESIPQLVNQPGGNAKIVTTMKAINSYDREIVRIASDVANRKMTPAEGRDAMNGLANPLEGFSATLSQDTGPKKVGSKEEYDAMPSGTTFIDPKGITRMKP